MALNLTKVAFGCVEIDTLRDRLAGRAVDGTTFVTTRYKPKRAGEVIGGSLFWIVKHRLIARSPILGFDDEAEPGRVRILLDAALLPVRAAPKRAHQGWRYLEAADAPADLGGAEADGIAALPGAMVAELSALMLI